MAWGRITGNMKARFSLSSGSPPTLDGMSTNYGWDVTPTPEGNNLPAPEVEPVPKRPASGIRLLAAGVAICLIGLIGGIGVGWSLARSNAAATATVQGPIASVPQSTGGQAAAGQPNG